jgi:hypothetical protein
MNTSHSRHPSEWHFAKDLIDNGMAVRIRRIPMAFAKSRAKETGIVATPANLIVDNLS